MAVLERQDRVLESVSHGITSITCSINLWYAGKALKTFSQKENERKLPPPTSSFIFFPKALA